MRDRLPVSSAARAPAKPGERPRAVPRRFCEPDWPHALDSHLERQIRNALLSEDASPAAAHLLRSLLLESHAAHIGALVQRAELRAVIHRMHYSLGGLAFVHTIKDDVPIANSIAAELRRADRTPTSDAALLGTFRRLHEKVNR
jgi:hypothetical protein